MFEKRRVTVTMAIAVLSTSMVFAAEKIDINKYDMITIYKNAPSFVAKMEKKGAKFANEGTNPYKIMENTTFSCKDLGFSKHTKKDWGEYVQKSYTKMVKNDVEAICDEKVYKGGTENFAVLVDGND